MQRIWPTLRLGVLSTSIAYLALVFSGSTGLAQLGLFTAAGIVVAMLVTRTWLPLFVSSGVADAVPGDAPLVRPVLSLPLGVIVLLATAAVTWSLANHGLWDDNLASLSPVPSERLAVDRDLRAAVTAPDLRYQLVLIDDSLETLLDDCEQADTLLADARSDGLLEGWQAVCELLPSRQRQQARQAAIPDAAVLRARLQEAVAGTPFRETAFEPFVQSAAAATRLELLDPAMIAATPLAPWLQSHLLAVDSDWVALISLIEPKPSQLAARIEQWPLAANLVDIQAASVDLMHDYRRNALAVIAVAVVLILALLWYQRGQMRQMLWIGVTVAAALSTTCTITVLMHGGLTVMHLVALLLVLGLGLDYGLFLSRVESVEEHKRTRTGVFLCAVSTVLVFGILAGSSIPVLQFLGLTVATGSAANYVLAFLGSRRSRPLS